MVEVFKTNVIRRPDARMIRSRILRYYPEYEVNFDLSDCDRILRVSAGRRVDAVSIINVVGACGFRAEVLPDQVPAFEFPPLVLF